MMKILVIDDSQILRERLIGMLCEIKGVQVFGHHAEEQEVLRLLNQMRPDALIFDAQGSSKKGGIGILQRIKQNEYLPTIFIFSNEMDDAYKKKYLMAGADYYFNKTNGLKQISDKFLELIENKMR